MRDLSLHMLDIIGNSLNAGASTIVVELHADLLTDLLEMIIRDNGKGMDETFVNRMTDPFYTTRTTRPVGLGIPLLNELCELAGGSLSICSHVGQGTELQARLGLSDPSIDYSLFMRSPGKVLDLDFAEVRTQQADIAVNEPIVMDWPRQIID